ncbi:MAG: DUF5050 domain-containing protein, partial [Lachnospiraceae bacterium]|nr:DUF5050 domain-containing protein [Lachnospiraceae bacterium]
MFKKLLLSAITIAVMVASFTPDINMGSIEAEAGYVRSQTLKDGDQEYNEQLKSLTYYHKGYIYYTLTNGETSDIYRSKPDGGEIEKLGTVNSLGYINLIYGNYIYICDNPDFGYALCAFNMKTKESKGYNVGGNFNGHYKQFYMMGIITGSPGNYGGWILDAKKAKIITLSKAGSIPVIAGKKVCYIKKTKTAGKYVLMSCKYNGKNKKKLHTFSFDGYDPCVYKMTKQYCIISDGGEPGKNAYKYVFATG